MDGASEEARLDVICVQDDAQVGLMSMIESIKGTAEEHLERLNAWRRETVPASELAVGVQCGASDAFSGGSTNPVASGKKTWAEHWKLHNALVLFNPAPIT